MAEKTGPPTRPPQIRGGAEPTPPAAPAQSAQERFAALVEAGDPLALYVEKEGRWEVHTAHTRTHEGGPTHATERRVFVWPQSREATAALAHLGLTPD